MKTQDRHSKAIFIGGTGRSGTSILSKYLGTHSQIYQVPLETKFIADKDGVLDLYTSLTDNFNIVQGKVAIYRFIKLMDKYMNDPNGAPYIGYNLKKLTQDEYFGDQINKLIKSISYGKWHSWDKHTTDNYYIMMKILRILGKIYNKMFLLPINKIIPEKIGINYFNPKRLITKEWMHIPKYFDEEKELQNILGYFVKSLFFEMSRLNNKSHFCEATPSNMLHIDFLSSLIPDANFIHIVRNPIGVAFSMSQKSRFWAPNEKEKVVGYLAGIYDKLIKMEKFAISNNKKYKRVKLEDCSNSSTLLDINKFLGIDNLFDGSINFDSNKVNYWETKYSSKEIDYYKTNLSKYIKYFAY